MVNASGWWTSAFEGGAQGPKGEAHVDGAADRIADNAPGPGVEDDSHIGEAAPDRDVGDVDEPELMRSVGLEVACAVRKDRAVVPAVGRDDVAAPHPGLQIMLPHEAPDLLVVRNDPLLSKRSPDTTPAIRLELAGNSRDGLDKGRIIGLDRRRVVEGGAGDPHQPAALGGGEAAGPVMADIGPLRGVAPERSAPFRNSSSSACLPTRRSSAAIRAS